MPPSSPPIRCLTIDVEEYFHIEAAYGHVRWESWPRRVEESLDRLLGLLDEHGCRATLFFLGHVAMEQPALARLCARAGHEIACHGYGHDRLQRLDPDSFRWDLLQAKNRMEDQIGQPILGYRAPSWSITRDTAWAIDVLAEAGLRYDASIFPVRHPAYGVPDAPIEPYLVRRDAQGPTLLELPPLVWPIRGRNLPAAGGAYFRILPLGLMLRALAAAEAAERPAVLYFHPWEFDVHQPRMLLPLLSRVRTYTGIKSSLARLDRLLSLPGTWKPLGSHLAQFEAAAKSRPAFALAEE